MSSPSAIFRALSLGHGNSSVQYEYNELRKSIWLAMQRHPQADESLLDKFEREPDVYTLALLDMLRDTGIPGEVSVDYAALRLADAFNRVPSQGNTTSMNDSNGNAVGNDNNVDNSIHITKSDLEAPETIRDRAQQLIDNKNFSSARTILSQAEQKSHLGPQLKSEINYLQAIAVLNGRLPSEQGRQDASSAGVEALRRLSVANELRPGWLPVQILWAAVADDFERNSTPQDVGSPRSRGT